MKRDKSICVLFSGVLLFLSSLSFSQAEVFPIEDSKAMISVQTGLGGLTDLENSRTNTLSGNFSKVSLVYQFKSKRFINPIIGIDYTSYYVEYYNPFFQSQFEDFYSSKDYRKVGIGPFSGINLSLDSKKWKVFSNQILSIQSYQLKESYPSTIKPIIKKSNVSYHMQLGISLVVKSKVSIFLLGTGGRTLSSFTPEEGIYEDVLTQGKIFVWETGVMVGMGISLN